MVDQVLKGRLPGLPSLRVPDLQDFVGRVVVEALSAGDGSGVADDGAVGTIVHGGVNGIVVDPRDASALAGQCTADPEMSRALREGVQQTDAALRPEAATELVLSAVARA